VLDYFKLTGRRRLLESNGRPICSTIHLPRDNKRNTKGLALSLPRPLLSYIQDLIPGCSLSLSIIFRCRNRESGMKEGVDR
jgi:hypothetical protein